MKYFKVYELVDEETYKLLGDEAIKLLDKGLLKDLESLRERLNKKIHINNWRWGGNLSQRGYRSRKSKTGSMTSQHRLGKAVDFDVEGMTAKEVRKYILDNKELYPSVMRMEDDVKWLHFDCKKPRRDIYIFKP